MGLEPMGALESIILVIGEDLQPLSVEHILPKEVEVLAILSCLAFLSCVVTRR